jgi:hypothetical protein
MSADGSSATSAPIREELQYFVSLALIADIFSCADGINNNTA